MMDPPPTWISENQIDNLGRMLQNITNDNQ
jgi:hypothetical protein